jgi:hypothetical protein
MYRACLHDFRRASLDILYAVHSTYHAALHVIFGILAQPTASFVEKCADCTRSVKPSKGFAVGRLDYLDIIDAQVRIGLHIHCLKHCRTSVSAQCCMHSITHHFAAVRIPCSFTGHSRGHRGHSRVNVVNIHKGKVAVAAHHPLEDLWQANLRFQ